MARRKRKRPSMTMIAASALLHMPQLDRAGRPVVDGMGRLIPWCDLENAKKLTARQIISLFRMDHGIYFAWGGACEPWNFTPRLIMADREKTGCDIKIIAKVRRKEKRDAGKPARRKAVMAGSKASLWKRTMSGKTIRRDQGAHQ